jgi:predicted phage terminase large subunit-like protein
MPELMAPSSLIPLSHELLAGRDDCHWHAQRTYWSFSSGARLSFGHCEREDDKHNYKSAAYQFIGFDEASAFSETVYTYLFSRLRKSTKIGDIPLRVRCASNPDGAGSVWLKRRFITEGKKHGRVFIPAKIDDNPYLDRTSYLRSLANLDPYTRSQLLDGNWDAKPPGAKFHRSWFANRIVEAVPAGMQKVRFWDLASTSPEKGKDPDYTAGVLMGVYDGRYYVMDVRRDRNTPKNIQDLVIVTAALDGPEVMIRMEQEPGSGGVNTIDTYTRLLAKYDFKGIKSTGSKEVRANPFSAQCQAGNVSLLSGSWIDDFLEEIEIFPYGFHDDQCLAEGTSIYTKRGHIPIEQVNDSDYTMTRIGFQKIEWAGITAENARLWELDLTDGRRIVGTGNHPIYTKENGFTKLCDLKVGQELCELKRLNLMEGSIDATPTLIAPRNEGISGQILMCGESTGSGCRPPPFTETSGNSTTARFRKVATFITLMGTRLTTQSTTWPALRLQNIIGWTKRTAHMIPTGLRRTWRIAFGRLKHIGEAPRVVLGEPTSMGRRISSHASRSLISAPSAVLSLCQNSTSARSIAQPNAKIERGLSLTQRSSLFADTAASHSKLISGIETGIAPIRVASVRITNARGKVYNLRVANQHEYFANGILVHNCDAAAGAFLVCAELQSTSTLDDILVVGNVQKPVW